MPASLGEKPNREKVPQTFQYGPINPHSKAHQERRVPGSILTSPLVPYLQYDIAPPLGKRSSRRSRYLTVGRAFRTSSKPKGQINRRVHERARTIKRYSAISKSERCAISPCRSLTWGLLELPSATIRIISVGIDSAPSVSNSKSSKPHRHLLNISEDLLSYQDFFDGNAQLSINYCFTEIMAFRGHGTSKSGSCVTHY